MDGGKSEMSKWKWLTILIVLDEFSTTGKLCLFKEEKC